MRRGSRNAAKRSEGDVFGAGNRVRTGDIQLGKLTLYQLSYARAAREYTGRDSVRQRPARKRARGVVVGFGREEACVLPRDLLRNDAALDSDFAAKKRPGPAERAARGGESKK